MDCRTAHALMEDTLERGVEPPVESLAAHMRGCSACAAEWPTLKALDVALRSLSLAEPPPAFVQSTMRRVAPGTHMSLSQPDLSATDATMVFFGVALVSLIVGAWVHHVGVGGLVDPHAILLGKRLMAESIPTIPTGPERVVMEITMAALVAALWSAAVLLPRRPIMIRLPR